MLLHQYLLYIQRQRNEMKMITDFTMDELLAELKKRGCKITVEKPKKYELQTDCWSIVKEFAGIYNHGTQWNKLEKIALPKIAEVFYETTRCRLIFSKSYTTAMRKQRTLKRLLTEFRTKRVLDSLYALVKTPDEKWLEARYIGEEVMVKNCLGVIRKINKKTVGVSIYKLNEDFQRNEDGRMFKFYDKTILDKPITVSKIQETTQHQNIKFHPWR